MPVGMDSEAIVTTSGGFIALPRSFHPPRKACCITTARIDRRRRSRQGRDDLEQLTNLPGILTRPAADPALPNLLAPFPRPLRRECRAQRLPRHELQQDLKFIERQVRIHCTTVNPFRMRGLASRAR